MAHPLNPPSRLGRRTLLRQLLAIGAAGAALLPDLIGQTAWAAPAAPPPPPGSPPDKADAKGVTVSPQDPAITAGAVEYPGLIGTMQGYLAAPVGGEFYPGVLVLHDAIGLTEHVRDVTRRFARVGYTALAPDLLSRLGGTAKVGAQAKVIAALESMSATDYLNALNASIRYLEARPQVSKTRIGVIGFGLGASLTLFLINANKDIKAAVVFPAQTPDPSAAPQITAPVLALFGDDDKTATDGLQAFDDAMKKAGAAWQSKTEPKAGRGFFDDSRTTYVADAAKDAWKLTLDWFNKYLQS
jgi:carboxymethylenebutenolidase